MKKYLALVFAMLMSFAFVSCGEDEAELEYFIKFNVIEVIDNEPTTTSYAWGDNAQSFAQQTVSPSKFTMKAQDSGNSAHSIEIVLTSAPWVGSHANAEITLKLAGKTYTGTANVALTAGGQNLSTLSTPCVGTFTSTSISAGSDTISITGGVINLARSEDN